MQLEQTCLADATDPQLPRARPRNDQSTSSGWGGGLGTLPELRMLRVEGKVSSGKGQ